MVKKRVAFWWQIVLYILAVLLIAVTVVSVVLDKDNIAAHYQQRRNEGTADNISFSKAFDGSGTEGDPYRIGDIDDLETLRRMIAGGAETGGIYFAQTDNIDLIGVRWTPIGSWEHPFQGVYDGYGYQIQNMRLEEENTSFIGVWSGEIRNLGFSDTVISANNCAVIGNQSGGANGRVANCIISGVMVPKNSIFSDVASVVNDLSGCSVLNIVIVDIPETMAFFTRINQNAYVFDCLYGGQSLGVFDKLIQSGNVYRTECSSDDVSTANEKIRNMSDRGMRGMYNLLAIDAVDKISYSNERVYVHRQEKMEDFLSFLRIATFYLAIIIFIVLIALLVAKLFHFSPAKCVFYLLMATFVIVLLLFGALSRGEWIISMLYDGKHNGELKYFTDFTDILIPGGDPYTRVDTYYTSIYPPFVSLIMAILQRFIPAEEMVDSMTIRNSQMGNMIYLFWVFFWMILLYEMVMAYKKGQKKEKIMFFGLLCASYPMIHCLERGNVVFIVGILIAVYLYNYRSKSFWKRQLAFFALSAAAGFKIYPAILGVLLVKEKRYKDTLNCLAMGIIVNLLPSIAFRTGFSSIAYMLINALVYVDGNSFIGGKIDLSHILQAPREILHLPVNLDPMQYYDQIVAVILVLTVVVVLFSRMADWKIYMLCIMDLILLASFSPYYYILYTIAPLMMFLDTKSKKMGLNVVYAILFAGIFMTFVSNVKYPVSVYAPTQSVWHMTLVTGTFLVLFESLLLMDGVASCVKRAFNFVRSRNGKQK